MQVADKSKVTYQVAGQDVTLSYNIVKNYLTKGNGTVSDTDVVQFISVCKFNQLNPFLNEAYLVKFGSQPAQMIVSKEAYMKRADACPTYKGMRAGVIVERNGEIVEVEGTFCLSTDKLLGGWAEVYRSDRDYPFVSKVNLSDYDKKQSIWNEKKSTMIAKIAKVQALREAFPAQLGAMYTEEEARTVVDADVQDVTSTSEAKATEVMAKAKKAMRKAKGEAEEVKPEEEKRVEPETEQVEPEAEPKGKVIKDDGGMISVTEK